jgi:hypothetical protein
MKQPLLLSQVAILPGQSLQSIFCSIDNGKISAGAAVIDRGVMPLEDQEAFRYAISGSSCVRLL